MTKERLIDKFKTIRRNSGFFNVAFRDASHSLIYSFITVVDCDKDAVTLQEGENTDNWQDCVATLQQNWLRKEQASAGLHYGR